jgi:2,4-dienoyl-CoA reductase (NADPH2)
MIQTNETKKEITLEGIDIYVVTTGMKADKTLANKIEGKIPVHIVGDADQVGDAVSAIQSAYFICKEL